MGELIDPAKGLLVVEAKRSAQHCGEEAMLFAEAAERDLDANASAEDIECDSVKRSDHCLVHLDVDHTLHEMEFHLARGGRWGYVVTTVVYREEEGGRPRPTTIAKREQAVSRCPATLAPSTPTSPGERREKPEGDLNPSVVTKEMMRNIADGSWPIARFIDKTRGLIQVWDTQGEDSFNERSALLCGPALDDALPALRRELAELITDRPEGDVFECRNAPYQPMCHVVHIGEWGIQVDYRFKSTSRGLFLEAVTFLNSSYLDSNARRFIAQHLARERHRPCDVGDGQEPQ